MTARKDLVGNLHPYLSDGAAVAAGKQLVSVRKTIHDVLGDIGLREPISRSLSLVAARPWRYTSTGLVLRASATHPVSLATPWGDVFFQGAYYPIHTVVPWDKLFERLLLQQIVLEELPAQNEVARDGEGFAPHPFRIIEVEYAVVIANGTPINSAIGPRAFATHAQAASAFQRVVEAVGVTKW